jgi:nitrogen-specific signal transduction histidine kinase
MSNLAIASEKNKCLTIFESLGNPVIHLDNNLQIHYINHAAAKLFNFPETPGRTYYGKNIPEDFLPWLAVELESFTDGDSAVMKRP